MTTPNVVLSFAERLRRDMYMELGSTSCWDNGSRHMILRTILCRNHHNWMSLPISDGQKLALEMFFHKANNDINEIVNHGYDDLSDRQKNTCISDCVEKMVEYASSLSC